MARSPALSGCSLASLLGLAALLAGCAAPAEPPSGGSVLAPSGCADPCAITIETGRLWEPMVAVDPRDPLHWVVSSQLKGDDPTTGPTSWALSHVTFDGGRTWSTQRIPGGQDVPPDHPLRATTWMDDSVPLFLPDGTLLWTVLAFEFAQQVPVAAATGIDLVALRSHDGGITFPDAVVVAGGDGGDVFFREPVFGNLVVVPSDVSHDKQWVALADDGTVVLAWSENFAGRPECVPEVACTRLLFSTTRDGMTWTPPSAILQEIVSGAFPLLLADGTWLVSYHRTQEQEAAIARSTDAGATWSTQVLGASTKFPVLARAPIGAGERVYIAYPAGQDDRDGEQRVVTRWSDDGGATWSDELVVATPTTPGRTIPALASAGDGGVHLAYWMPEGEGATFRAVLVREGLVSAPLDLGVHEGPTSVTGDYMGLVSLPDGGAVAAWTASEGDALRLVAARIGDG